MNTRKTILAALFAAAFVAPLSVAPVHAQVAVQAQRSYTQAELDQMLAPIALYPDSLLSQVLMAATYPIEVVEAARWVRANPGLQGDDAVRAVQEQDWDPSVKSLVAFPQVLERMDENLDWTRSLGDAFLAQEPQLMDEVQLLRRRAQAQGNLQSSEQIRVEQEGQTIMLEPASPQYVYVPYYDPMVVYGPWWWPAYRPVAWAPWPGYARPYRPGPSVGFWWGRPVGLSVNFFFGGFDWRQRHVRIANSNSFYYRQPAFANRGYGGDRGRWQHDPQHRRNVDYRQAEVRQRFANTQVERRAAVREERRDDLRQGRRDQQIAAPAQQRTEQREERRQDRREERQTFRQAPAAAAPAAAARVQPQVQAPAQPRVERRQERREERRVERVERPAPQVQQPQVRQEQRREQRVERREQRQEQRAPMPAAQAVQSPRVERQAQREERREQRHERGPRG